MLVSSIPLPYTGNHGEDAILWNINGGNHGLGTLLENLSTDQLEQACKEEIRAFTEQVQKSIGACYELFKRALSLGDNLAFSAILNNFRYRVESWIINQPGFPNTDRNLDFFVSVSFSRFYVALHKRNVADFPNVAAFLGYLRACAVSAVQQELRHRKREKGLISIDDERLHPSALIDKSKMTLMNEALDQNQVWKRIETLFPEERSQRLIRLRFVEQLKPAEIAAKYPDEWATARDVTVDLYSIRKKLRYDPDLRQLAGVDPAED